MRFVGGDEVEDEGLALGVAGEGGAVAGVVAEAGDGGDRLGEAAVEALGHAVGFGR